MGDSHLYLKSYRPYLSVRNPTQRRNSRPLKDRFLAWPVRPKGPHRQMTLPRRHFAGLAVRLPSSTWSWVGAIAVSHGECLMENAQGPKVLVGLH